ncbi:MAG: hypothetical protein AABY40_01015 [Nanoarchaeota archaeon]
MSKKWPYVLAALGGFALGGITSGTGGYMFGYHHRKPYNEPVVLIEDINKDGNDDLCVMMNKYEARCAMDYNRDGAQDIVEFDLDKVEITKISYGKNPCQVQSLDELLEYPEPKQPINL